MATASMSRVAGASERHESLLLEDLVARDEVGEGVRLREKRSDSLAPMPRNPFRHSESRNRPNARSCSVAVEVDQHVAAGDQLHFREHAVGGQAVVGEYDVVLSDLSNTALP